MLLSVIPYKEGIASTINLQCLDITCPVRAVSRVDRQSVRHAGLSL